MDITKPDQQAIYREFDRKSYLESSSRIHLFLNSKSFIFMQDQVNKMTMDWLRQDKDSIVKIESFFKVLARLNEMSPQLA